MIFLANCGTNEVYSRCAPDCEAQCQIYVGPRCPAKQRETCYRKCICGPGFIRSEYNNECIEEESPYCGGKYIPELIEY